MATGTTKIAQVARIVCHLCDRENEVEWKCIQCEEGMCNDCKITHLRSKMSRGHTVTTFRELMMSSPSQSEANKISSSYCHKHKTEIAQMYCLDCRVTICLDCLSTIHKKHEFEKISNVVNGKREELIQIISQSKVRLSKCKTCIQLLKRNSDDYSEETKDAIASVKKQGDAVKRRVDNIVQGFIDNYEAEKNETKKCLEEVQKEFEVKVNDLEQIISDCENKLKSQNDASIIEVVLSTKQKLVAYKADPRFSAVHPSKFVTGNINETDLITAVGYTEKHRCQNLPDISPDVPTANAIQTATVVTSFISPVNLASCIATVDNSHAWIGWRWNSEKVVLVSVDGKVKQRIQLDFTLGDIAVTPSGELLVTECRGHHIKRLTQAGQFVDIIHTSPFIPKGLDVTPDNDILVCLSDNNGNQGKVTRTSITGQIKQNIQYDKHSKALFAEPMLVCQNVNKDVCVVDTKATSIAITTLTVVDKDEQLRFRYSGQTDVNMKLFACYGIACDMSGNILVSDRDNNVIHQLDKDGRFIQYILTSHRINKPRGLSLDKYRQMWICNGTNDIIMVVKLK